MQLRKRSWTQTPWPAVVPAAALAVGGVWGLMSLPPALPTTAPFHRLAVDASWLMIISAYLIALSVAGHIIFPEKTRIGLRRDHWRTIEQFGLFVAVLIAVALLYNRIAATKTAIIDGRRFFWLDDDMMISMRYARNFAAGLGLVWNGGGPRVEGITNFLWTMVMALPHLAGMPDRLTSLPILILNGLLVATLIVASWRAGRLMGLEPSFLWLGVLMLAANRWVIYWAAGGGEAVVMAVLVMLIAGNFLAAKRPHPVGIGTAILIGALGLTRADAPVLVVAFLIVWAGLALRGRAGRWSWLPAVILPVLLFLFRRFYYGDWFPNTYYLRMTGIPTRPIYGFFYIIYYLMLFGGMIGLAVLALGLARRQAARMLAIVPMAVLAYGVYCGGDELIEYRFFVPVMGLIVLLALESAASALRRRRLKFPRWSPSLCLGVTILAFIPMAIDSLALPESLKQLGAERARHEIDNVRIGLALRQYTDRDAVVAHFWAGAAPYFSDRPALDFLGKNDPMIAHLEAAPGDYQPAHNKYSTEFIAKYRPDVIVAGIPGASLQPHASGDAPEPPREYPGLSVPLMVPEFSRDYVAVATPLSLNRHGVFLRRDSARVNPPRMWRDPEAGKK